MGISFELSTLAIDSDLLIANTISGGGDTLQASSYEMTTVVLQLKDSNGVNYTIPDQDVEFFATKGSFLFQFDSASDSSYNPGKYSATYMADSGSGESIITATVNGTLIQDTAIITLVPGQPDYESADIKSDPSTIDFQNREKSLVTLTVVDSAGNIVAEGGHAVVFESEPSGTFTNVIDNEDGTYNAYFSAQFEGDYLISAKIDTVEVLEKIEIVAKEQKGASINNPVDGFRLPPGSGGAGGIPIALSGLSKLPYATWPNTREARSLLREPLNRNGFNMAALLQQGIIGLPIPIGFNPTGIIPGGSALPMSAAPNSLPFGTGKASLV